MAATPPGPTLQGMDPAVGVGMQEGTEMNPLSTYELAKLRIAERHEEATRERLDRLARASSNEQSDQGLWKRWMQRRLASRLTLAQGGA